jgi:peptidoglycan/xylan/chitin deacetylase (PgdA/CDA1 family)
MFCSDLFKSMLRNLVGCLLFPCAWLISMARPGIRILMYHRVFPETLYDQLNVQPELFERHIRFLTEHYVCISLTEALQRLRQGRYRNEVVVTFDDGYLDNLQYAFPILEHYKVPATFFITTEFADQKKRHSRYKSTQNRLHLNWEELLKLAQNPLVEIGSHTCSHPFLPRIPPDQMHTEVCVSFELLQLQLGLKPQFFCYPSGDYGKRELEYLPQTPYLGAVTVSPGVNRKSTPVYQLRRTEVTDKDSPFVLWLKLTGAFDFPHKLLDCKRRHSFAHHSCKGNYI